MYGLQTSRRCLTDHQLQQALRTIAEIDSTVLCMHTPAPTNQTCPLGTQTRLRYLATVPVRSNSRQGGHQHTFQAIRL